MDDVEIYAPVLEAEGRPGEYLYTVSLQQALPKELENRSFRVQSDPRFTSLPSISP